MPDPDLTALLTAIGNNVRTLREARGLTQSQVSELCGIEPAHLQRVEYGTGAPSLRLLARLAEVFQTEVWWLCKPTASENPARRPGRPKGSGAK